jgi:hypothetical protein
MYYSENNEKNPNPNDKNVDMVNSVYMHLIFNKGNELNL